MNEQETSAFIQQQADERDMAYLRGWRDASDLLERYGPEAVWKRAAEYADELQRMTASASEGRT